MELNEIDEHHTEKVPGSSFGTLHKLLTGLNLDIDGAKYSQQDASVSDCAPWTPLWIRRHDDFFYLRFTIYDLL